MKTKEFFLYSSFSPRNYTFQKCLKNVQVFFRKKHHFRHFLQLGTVGLFFQCCTNHGLRLLSHEIFLPALLLFCILPWIIKCKIAYFLGFPITCHHQLLHLLNYLSQNTSAHFKWCLVSYYCITSTLCVMVLLLFGIILVCYEFWFLLLYSFPEMNSFCNVF